MAKIRQALDTGTFIVIPEVDGSFRVHAGNGGYLFTVARLDNPSADVVIRHTGFGAPPWPDQKVIDLHPWLASGRDS